LNERDNEINNLNLKNEEIENNIKNYTKQMDINRDYEKSLQEESNK